MSANNIAAADKPKVRTFSALQNSAFRAIWGAMTFSHIGSVIQITAAAWLMTSLTQSSTLVALVQSAAAFPVMFLALFAGATADIYDKRTQMIVAAGLCAVSAFLLVAMYELGLLEPWSLLLLTAIMGISGAFYSPAWQSSLPEIVSKTHLVSAISVNNLSINVARCLGPALAAEILVRLGAGIAFMINGASFVVLIGTLFLWKGSPKKSTLPKEGIFRAIADGLRYAVLSSAMRTTLLRGFCFSLCASAIMALPPVIAVYLGGGARTLGILLVGFGAGATSGALCVSWMRNTVSVNTLSLASFAIMSASLACLGFSQHIWLSTAAFYIGGFAWVQTISILQISIQTSCPRWVAGRMVSSLAMIFSAGIAGGSAIWGVTADVFNVSSALWLAAAALFVAALLMRLLPFSQPIEEDLEPHTTTLIDTAPKLDPKAGPVWIEVNYRVARADMDDFMGAMFALRHVRVRDGARNWSLSQDISNNGIWIEQFQSPTWGDYLHRVSRRVVGDVAVQERVLKFCKGEPKWRRKLERTAQAKPLDDTWPDE